MLKFFTDRLIGTLFVLDIWLNVLWGKDKNIPAAGNPHYTVSERLAEMRKLGSKTGCYGCEALTIIANFIRLKTKDHCLDAMSGVPWSIPTDG